MKRTSLVPQHFPFQPRGSIDPESLRSDDAVIAAASRYADTMERYGAALQQQPFDAFALDGAVGEMVRAYGATVAAVCDVAMRSLANEVQMEPAQRIQLVGPIAPLDVKLTLVRGAVEVVYDEDDGRVVGVRPA